MDKIKIEFEEFTYHFRKYGDRMFQKASIFLNDKKIYDYNVVINFYLDDKDNLKDCISIDNYNYNNALQNKGLATKVVKMLINFYKKQGFNKFAFVVANDYENGKKINKPFAKIAQKLDFKFKQEITSIDKDFTLDVFEKIYSNDYILKNKDNYEKEQYFRKFGGIVLNSKIELKNNDEELQNSF